MINISIRRGKKFEQHHIKEEEVMRENSSGQRGIGQPGFGFKSIIHLLFLCFILAMTALPASAEGPYDIYWKAQMGTTGTDTANGTAGDGAGNVYVVGNTAGALDGNTYNGGTSDAFIVKYDINGAQACSALLGTSGDDVAYGVAVYDDGSAKHVYVVGSTNGALGTQVGGTDMFLAEFNDNCVLQGTVKQDGTSGTDIAWAVAADSSGNIFVAGETNGNFSGTGKGGKDIFIAEYNSSLVNQYKVQAGTSANDIAYSIALDSNGDPNIVGETSGDLDAAGTQTYAGAKDFFWAKYASSTFTVMKQLGTAADDVANGIGIDSSDNVYISGYSAGDLGGTNAGTGTKDIVVAKYDSTGAEQWLTQFGTASDDTGESIAVEPASGDVFIVGVTDGNLDGYTTSGTVDAFMAKFNTAGVKLWTKQIGTTGADSSWSAVWEEYSSSIYLAGETTGDFSGTNADATGTTTDLIVAQLAPDQYAPNVTIDTKPANPSNSQSADFTFSCKDKDPITNLYTLDCNNSTFQCKMDSGSYTACTSPKSYAGLAANTNHTFYVKATDASGNVSLAASYIWKIDTSSPVTTIGAFTSPTNDTTPTFSFTANETGVTFQCSLDTGTPVWVACTNPKTYGVTPAGTYTFRVKGTDPAGNEELSPNTGTLIIDITAPTLSTTPTCPGVGDPAYTNVAAVSFTFASTDTDLAAQPYWCSKDGGAFVSCSSPYGYTPLAGVRSFSVKAKDLAGNYSTASTCSWTLDLTKPTTTIKTNPTSPSGDNTPTFTFGANEASSYECSLELTTVVDPASWVWEACGAGYSITGTYTFALHPDGAYTFRVRATDRAGNTETTFGSGNTKALAIDTGVPTLSTTPTCPGVGDPAYTNVAAVSFTFASDDTDLAAQPYWCSKDGAAFAACSSPYGYTAAAGVRSFSVKAKDLAGNYSTTSTCNWTLDMTKPITTIKTNPKSPGKDNTPTFTFGANEASSYECSLELTTVPVGSVTWEACGAGYSTSGSHTFATKADGAYTFRVRATDRAGNTETTFGTSNTKALTIDTTAPASPSITSKPSNPSKVVSPSFSFTAETGAKFTCQLDTYAAGVCSTGKSYSNLSEGDHTFSVWATDVAGNKSAAATYPWVIDKTAPDTVIDVYPAAYSNVGTGTFEFSSSDPTAVFECKLTPATTYSACSSPYAYGSGTPLSAGTRTFYVRAKDAAGNADGTPASYIFTVDKTAPNTFMGIKPEAVSTDTTPRFTFSSSEYAATFECSLDGAAFAACNTPYQVAPALSAVAHTFAVRSTDQAGNTDSTPVSHSWTIDTSLPNATITVKPVLVTKQTTATFSFSSNKANATFECSLDNAAYTTCTSPKAYTGLLEGDHTFGVRAKNANGTGSSDVWDWTIDLTAPDAAITVTPPSLSNDSTPTFEFTSADPTVTKFLCKIDAGSFLACTSPYTRTTALVNGTHTFNVQAKDPAGNIGTAVSYTWDIDVSKPDTVLGTKPVNPSNDATPTFAFSSPDASATFECDIDGGSTPSWTACSSPKTYSPALANGQHTFKVRAKDAAGNVDTSPAVYTWTIDTVAPNTTIVLKPANPSGADVSFTFSSSQTPATFECMMSPDTAYSACTSPMAYTGLAVGSHTFRVRAIDNAGNKDASPAVYTWTVQ